MKQYINQIDRWINKWKDRQFNEKIDKDYRLRIKRYLKNSCVFHYQALLGPNIKWNLELNSTLPYIRLIDREINERIDSLVKR